MSSRPEPLLQHTLGAGEPWRVVVTSMLLCRTRGDVAAPIITEVFRRWSTPLKLSNAKALAHVISPLGLGNIRALRIRVAAGLFSAEPLPTPERLREIDGVGKYVLDAYRLVCLDDRTIRPTDKALLRWLNESSTNQKEK